MVCQSHAYLAYYKDYAASMPFMTVAGNHEAQYEFAGYKNRLHMPQPGTGVLTPFYYSFDYGNFSPVVR